MSIHVTKKPLITMKGPPFGGPLLGHEPFDEHNYEDQDDDSCENAQRAKGPSHDRSGRGQHARPDDCYECDERQACEPHNENSCNHG